MAYRRRQQQSVPDHSSSPAPNNMDQLTFKYMEMCKLESSTDSDSEISPRWSDTSAMECVSSAPESGSLGRRLSLAREPGGRHGCYSLFLDPYDGSSEDSDELNIDEGVTSRQTRQHGKCGRLSRRSRRCSLHHPPIALREVLKNGARDLVTEQQCMDVQMKCGSGSELWVCDLVSDGCKELTEELTNDSTIHIQALDIKLHHQLDDSGLSLAWSPPSGHSAKMLDSSSERSPNLCNLKFLYKRKLGVPGNDTLEQGQRKRQCVVNMEDQPERGDSAS